MNIGIRETRDARRNICSVWRYLLTCNLLADRCARIPTSRPFIFSDIDMFIFLNLDFNANKTQGEKCPGGPFYSNINLSSTFWVWLGVYCVSDSFPPNSWMIMLVFWFPISWYHNLRMKWSGAASSSLTHHCLLISVTHSISSSQITWSCGEMNWDWIWRKRAVGESYMFGW